MALLNFKEILELIDKVADKGLGAVEVESSGVRVRIEGRNNEPMIATYLHDGGTGHSGSPMQAIHSPASIQLSAPSHGQALAASAVVDDAESDEGLHIVTSPIVGTFYRSPNPESPPFMNPGDRISKGQVLCIVEAMKLMNEIESDIEGVVVRIYPQNGQPVEYGEKLFAVRLS